MLEWVAFVIGFMAAAILNAIVNSRRIDLIILIPIFIILIICRGVLKKLKTIPLKESDY